MSYSTDPTGLAESAVPTAGSSIGELIARVAELSPAQNNTLTVLSGAVQPMTVAQIAGALELHPNSVRETLDALVKAGLVVRTRLAPQGRGRPSWAYEAVAPASVDSFTKQLTYLCRALAEHLQRNTADAVAQAHSIGRLWAAQMLEGARVPDHSGNDHEAESHRLDVHTQKVRMFVSSLGFAAVTTADPHVFELHHCPLLGRIPPAAQAGDGSPSLPVACALHRGMLDGLLELTSGGRVEVDLVPAVRPGVCRVALLVKQWGSLRDG